jgi:hypothetical protein
VVGNVWPQAIGIYIIPLATLPPFAVSSPKCRFDIIFFNECFEHIAFCYRDLERYEQSLNMNGVYIVSISAVTDTARSWHIWEDAAAFIPVGS